MEYLFDALGSFRERIDTSSRILMLLDYDGTITPIVEKPELAVLSEETRGLLRSIARLPRHTLCIVSGRPIMDVKNLAGVDDIYYIGNHGLEAEGPDVDYLNPDAVKTKPLIDEIYLKLASGLNLVEGVLIEHKNITLAVHYRMVSENDIPKVRSVFTEIVQPYAEKGDIKMAENKMTLEVLPNVDWDKGKMILDILNLLCHDSVPIPIIGFVNMRGMLGVNQVVESQKLVSTLPVYIGDDKTDEDAFKAINDRGISIVVAGQGRDSCAQYYVRDVSEVIKFLQMLKEEEW